MAPLNARRKGTTLLVLHHQIYVVVALVNLKDFERISAVHQDPLDLDLSYKRLD